MLTWLRRLWYGSPFKGLRTVIVDGLEVQVGRVRIVHPELLKGARIGVGTKLFIDDKEIDRVQRIELVITPDQLITVKVEVAA